MQRTLLLVDDESNIIASLTRLFRRDGYTILSATSGEQALAILADKQIGVIISDQRMPNMTGTEFLSRARTIQPDCVRIVLSGYTELTSITEAINRGAVFRFLTKPWEDESLREQVRDAFIHFELRINNERLGLELKEKNAELERAKAKLEIALASTVNERDIGISALRITQQVMDEAPVAIIGYSLDGMVVVCNQKAYAIFPMLFPGANVANALPAELRDRVLDGQTSGEFVQNSQNVFHFQISNFMKGNHVAGRILTLTHNIPIASSGSGNQPVAG